MRRLRPRCRWRCCGGGGCCCQRRLAAGRARARTLVCAHARGGALLAHVVLQVPVVKVGDRRCHRRVLTGAAVLGLAHCEERGRRGRILEGLLHVALHLGEELLDLGRILRAGVDKAETARACAPTMLLLLLLLLPPLRLLLLLLHMLLVLLLLLLPMLVLLRRRLLVGWRLVRRRILRRWRLLEWLPHELL